MLFEKNEGMRVKNTLLKEVVSIWFVLVLEFKLIEGLEMQALLRY